MVRVVTTDTALAHTLNIEQIDSVPESDALCLRYIDTQLSLEVCGSNYAPLSISFNSGKLQHRRDYGGGAGQLLARAVGVKKLNKPDVLDLSAGFGQDAFVLACLGCQVTMLERSPIMAVLLEDALRRLNDDSLMLRLLKTNSLDYLNALSTLPDVIYFDPMYPDTKNSALPKKEMRVLRELVGDDDDAVEVFQLALKKAKRRVVVKRPRLGDCISECAPDVVFEGKSGRFDMYVTNAL